jgi:hypothetical protein
VGVVWLLLVVVPVLGLLELLLALLVVELLAELPHAASVKQAPRMGSAIVGLTRRPLRRSVGGRRFWMSICSFLVRLVVVWI